MNEIEFLFPDYCFRVFQADESFSGMTNGIGFIRNPKSLRAMAWMVVLDNDLHLSVPNHVRNKLTPAGKRNFHKYFTKQMALQYVNRIHLTALHVSMKPQRY